MWKGPKVANSALGVASCYKLHATKCVTYNKTNGYTVHRVAPHAHACACHEVPCGASGMPPVLAHLRARGTRASAVSWASENKSGVQNEHGSESWFQSFLNFVLYFGMSSMSRLVCPWLTFQYGKFFEVKIPRCYEFFLDTGVPKS